MPQKAYFEDMGVNLSFHAYGIGRGLREDRMDTGWRCLPAPLIETPSGGRWELWLEGRRTPLTIAQGEACAVPSGLAHRLVARCSGSMTTSYLLAGFHWIMNLDVMSLAEIPVKLPGPAGADLKPLMDEMAGIWSDADGRLAGMARLHELGFRVLDELLRRAGQKEWWRSRPELSRVGKALEAIRSRPNDEHSCAELAARVGLSPSRFNAVFRKAVGAAPKVFMRGLRLRRACEALAGGDLPVYAVAEECGFNSAYYFCRLFTKRVGMSPREFRKAFSAGAAQNEFTSWRERQNHRAGARLDGSPAASCPPQARHRSK